MSTDAVAPSQLYASGADKCLQPWTELASTVSCSRCDIALHPPCPSVVDTTKAPAGVAEMSESIRICHNCLLPSESRNNFEAAFSAEGAGRLAKKAKVSETEPGASTATPKEASADLGSPQSMADLDWTTLLKPHSTINDLLQANKVCAPQATKKTIWWRLYHTWNMDDFGSEVDQPVSYCNLCGLKVKLSKVDRSPTPLKRHLQIQHKEIFKIMNQQKLQDGPVLSPPGSGAKAYYYTSRTMGQRNVNRTSQLKAITQWIIETDQPLDVVEAESFRKMTAAFVASPRHLGVFAKDDVAQYMSYLVVVLRHKMKDLLADQSLIHVQERWTSSNRCAYQGDRVHWIDDDFNLQNLVIACDFDKTLAPGESAETLWDSVGVVRERQVWGTISNITDPDAYNGAGGPLIYYRGVDVELNQIAEIAYEALGSNTRDLVGKARKLVQEVHSSAAMGSFLLKAQEELTAFFPVDQSPLPFILDSLPHHWWSTNEMIGRLLYLRKALEYLSLDSRLGDIELPSRQEWALLEKLQQAWKPFNIASRLLLKQKFVTVGLVPIILQIIGEDLNPESYQGIVKTCMKKMLTAWEERFGKGFPTNPFQGLSKLVWVAHALDPRFKSLDVFESTMVSKDIIFEAVVEHMLGLKIEETEIQTTTTSLLLNEAKKQKTTALSSELRALASSRFPGAERGHSHALSSKRSSPAASKSKKRRSSTISDSDRAILKEECLSELAAYKAVDGMKMWIEHDNRTKDFEDPLSWWKEHHKAFPTLWNLARRYLPIPATCAAADRAFDAEAYSELAKRCRTTQGSSSQDMKLLKENAALVYACEEPTESVDEEAQATETKNEKVEEERSVNIVGV